MIDIVGKHGGYRRTLTFGYVCLVYHATEVFCARNYSYKNDALGKTVGQKVGAARSARQNIVEGSSRAGTSKEAETPAMRFGAAPGIPIAMERGVSDDLRDGLDLRDRRGDDERDRRGGRGWRLSRLPRQSRWSSSNEIALKGRKIPRVSAYTI